MMACAACARRREWVKKWSAIAYQRFRSAQTSQSGSDKDPEAKRKIEN